LSYNNDLELAARTAVVTWNKREQALCQRVQQSSGIEDQLGKEWLNYWMLARTAPLDNRSDLYGYMTGAKVRLSNQSMSTQRAYCLVQTIAAEGAGMVGVWGRPLSLVSKLAFSCRPELFAPYDRRARIALKTKGHVTEGNYPVYMDAFHRELAEFIIDLRKARIDIHSPLLNGTVNMSQQIFELRTFDKYLMLLGGFSRAAMKQIVSGSDSKQHAPKRKGARKQKE
jgi:hypothetical protein